MSILESENNASPVIERAESFQALELPDDAVVIIDRALPQAWLDTFDDPIVVDAGESLKRLASIEALAREVLERRSTRPLTIVGVGGGSVGDAVGFLASTLWRGVDLWHVPTTLLAMVDSAHGGKTAVNLGEAKNQLGTFYLAKKVVLVDQALATLPLEQRRDGLAELVKGLWLGDEEALDLLQADGGVDQLAAAPFDEIGERMMALLERAIDVKLDIVDQDLYETKEIRTFLNFGHTVAHTLELHTGVSHGQAVCWGMLAASFLCDLPRQLPRLRRHVYALLTPSQPVMSFDDRDLFCAGIERDKKRIDGQLRSVLLDGPAQPYVTRDISADDWFVAFRKAVEWFEATPALVHREKTRSATLDIAASKSEMNRALVIAHLRSGRPDAAPTSIDGHSQADDVAWLKSCLQALHDADGPAEIYAGEGGTTFRFLLAVCAARPDETLLTAAPRLLERPHDALIDALIDAGATIEPVETDGARGFRVVGWQSWPECFEVSAALSSQYATALALLSATGHSFELVLADGGEVASRPYFDMTLDLLESAGVEVTRDGDTLRFSPTSVLDQPAILTAETDASSAAVWAFARLVGVEATVARPPTSGRQPDARAGAIAQELADAHTHGTERVEVDLSQSPDLAPVLAAVATQIDPAVDIVGAAHLRHKESDRIGDLAEALAEVDVRIVAKEDGMHIPPGVQTPRDGALWPTFGDHRLAMAGLLLTAKGISLQIEAPMVVAKSYPDFWHHARRLGWSVGQ